MVDHKALDILACMEAQPGELHQVVLTSADPEELTLRQARWLANADRIYHDATVPAAILDRARADADRVLGTDTAVLPTYQHHRPWPTAGHRTPDDAA